MHVAALGAGPRGRALTRRGVRAGHVTSWYDDATTAMDSVDTVAAELRAPNCTVGVHFSAPETSAAVVAVRPVEEGVATMPDSDRAAAYSRNERRPLARAEGVRLRDRAGRLERPTDRECDVWRTRRPIYPGELNPALAARADRSEDR